MLTVCELFNKQAASPAVQCVYSVFKVSKTGLDAANRLTVVGGRPSAVSYKYNGLGQRTEQTVDGVTTEYALDGSAGLTAGVAGGLPEVIATTTGGASTQYLQVQGQILAQYDSGTWGYALPDHLGSARTETDALGQVTVARHFDPFGVPLGADGGSPFGYTGEQWDASAGLAFLRARYYDPAVGRFLTEDSKPSIAYLPESLHTYVYAWNNPILLTDPSGLQPPPPECDDPGQICYTGTSGTQVTHPYSPTAEEVVATSSSNVLGLIRLFEMDHFPGDNAKERLQWILHKTEMVPGSYWQLALFPPGGSSFCEELADERFYTDPEIWARNIDQQKHNNVQMGGSVHGDASAPLSSQRLIGHFSPKGIYE